MNKNLSVYLDLVRFAAAIGVLLGHARRFLVPEVPKIVASHASECVAVFFVLSGFVICYVFRRGENSLSPYASSRLYRIFSVVIPAVMVTIISDRIGFKFNPEYYSSLEFWDGPARLREVLSSLLFINESWGRHVVMGTNEPYWSLGYEVAYYLAFAGIFIRSKLLKFVFFTLWLLVFGPKIAAYGVLWLLGVGAYELLRSDRLSELKLRYVIILVALPVLYPVLKYQIFPPVGAPMRYFSFAQWVTAYGYYVSIAVLCAGHIIGVALISRSNLFQVPKLLEVSIRWLAGATFTIYLMHQPLIVAAAALGQHGVGAQFSGLSALVFVLVVLFVLAECGERRKALLKKILERRLLGKSQSANRISP